MASHFDSKNIKKKKKKKKKNAMLVLRSRAFQKCIICPCSLSKNEIVLRTPHSNALWTGKTYYQSPKPELVLLPSPSSLPSIMFFTLLL